MSKCFLCQHEGPSVEFRTRRGLKQTVTIQGYEIEVAVKVCRDSMTCEKRQPKKRRKKGKA